MILLKSDTRPIPFFLALAADHTTGVVEATPVVTLSKNGGAFAAAAGAVAEIANGWYKLTPTSADTGTDGALILHAEAATADKVDIEAQVVAYDPYDAMCLGLSALPDEVAGESGGIPLTDILATAVPGAYAAGSLGSIVGGRDQPKITITMLASTYYALAGGDLVLGEDYLLDYDIGQHLINQGLAELAS